MPDQLFTYYIDNPLVMSINSGSWGGRVIWIQIETWVILKGGAKRGHKRVRVSGGRGGGYRVRGSLCVLGCSSFVVVEDACVTCRGMGCIQLVQYANQWVVSAEEGRVMWNGKARRGR
jgi:hypothetical protein